MIAALTLSILLQLTPQEIYDRADWWVHLEVTVDQTSPSGTRSLTGWSGGFIIDDRGAKLVITVAHIEGRGQTARRIMVHFRDYLRLEPQPAYIYSRHQSYDIAALRFSDENFVFPGQVARLGSAYRLRRGDQLVSLGSPMPLDERFYLSQGVFNELAARGTEIRHTCLTTYGNSGGPLVNMNGEVVGMNFRFTKADEGEHSPLDSTVLLPHHGTPCPYSIWSTARPIDLIRDTLPYLRRRTR